MKGRARARPFLYSVTAYRKLKIFYISISLISGRDEKAVFDLIELDLLPVHRHTTPKRNQCHNPGAENDPAVVQGNGQSPV